MRIRLIDKLLPLLLVATLQVSRRAGSTPSPPLDDYYATIPKLGPIKGLRPANEPGLVAFLNIPYAAAPVNLLRFMPPGAYVASSPAASQLIERRPLANQDQHHSRQLQRVPVRLHNQFGKDCVRLSDWLSDLTNGSASKSPAARLQSEDCLNLNVFVPIHEQPNHPSQAANHSAASSRDSPAQDTSKSIPLKSIQAATPRGNKQQQQPEEPPSRLPVLVLFQGDLGAAGSAKANSFSHLPIVRRADSIVITFNYRIGLLGFLPYLDTDDYNSNLSQLRINHAIWDQIGLLRWLKFNINQFNGDAGNVTLLALDNRGALYIQLLCLSPLTKGLFKRVVLVDKDPNSSDHNEQDDDLRRLIRSSQNGKELKRLLRSAVAQVINNSSFSALIKDSPMTTKDDQRGRKVSEFILKANLSQLALFEVELRQLASSESIVRLATGPTLEDQSLFPHLNSMLSKKSPGFELTNHYNHLIRGRINYCTYMRQVYLGHSNQDNLMDFLDLVPSKLNHQTAIQQLNLTSIFDWHRESNQERQQLSGDNYFNKTEMIAFNFDSLYNIQSLSTVLWNSSNSDDMNTPDSPLEPLENDDEDSMNRQSLPLSNSELSVRNRRSSEWTNFDQITTPVETIFGYFRSSKSHKPAQLQPQKNGSMYLNIVDQLINSTNQDERLLDWIRWLDLNYVTTLMQTNDTLAQYCDIFSRSTLRKRFSNNYAFLVNTNSDNQLELLAKVDSSEDSNWLLDSLEDSSLIDGLIKFIKHGDPNHQTSDKAMARQQTWPSYDLLNRKLRLLSRNSARGNSIQVETSIDKSQNLIKREMQIHLDLVPYLNSLSDNKTTEVSYSLVSDASLINCLNDIDSLLKNKTNQRLNYNEIDDEVKCLGQLAAKFRSHLRQYAADDLEPLTKLIQKHQQTHENQSVATSLSITTRNLLTNELLLEQQASHNQSAELADSNLVAYVSPRLENSLAKPVQLNSSTAELVHNLSSLLARAYKQAIGSPLIMVIGTGLSIIVLNLVIVIVISKRSGPAQTGARKGRGRAVHDSSPNPMALLSTTQVGQKRSAIKKTYNENSSQVDCSNRIKQLKFDLSSIQSANTADTMQKILQGANNNDDDDDNDEAMFNCLASQSVFQMNDIEREDSNDGQNQVASSIMFIEPTATLVADEMGATINCQHHQHSELCPMSQQQALQSSSSSPPFASNSNRSTITDQRNSLCTAETSFAMQQQQQQQANRGHYHYAAGEANGRLVQCNSTNSPNSSTTLSLTPIQLESLTISNSNGFVSPPSNSSYQLMEPIGLIYQTNDLLSAPYVSLDKQQQLVTLNPLSLVEQHHQQHDATDAEGNFYMFAQQLQEVPYQTKRQAYSDFRLNP